MIRSFLSQRIILRYFQDGNSDFQESSFRPVSKVMKRQKIGIAQYKAILINIITNL